MEKAFSISDIFSESWALFKTHWKFMVIATFIVMVVQGIFDFFGYDVDATGAASGSIPMSIIGGIVSIILGIGLIAVTLKLVRGEQADYKDLFTSSSFRMFFVYLGASILYSIMIVVGLILLIVPGIIVMVMFMPFVYLVVDKEMGVIDSLKEAKRITKGHLVDIFF